MTLARVIPVLALAAVACGAKEAGSITGAGGRGPTPCATDSQCAGGACVVGICVPPPAAIPGLAIEITPPPEAMSTAAFTERTGMVLNGRPVMLTTDEPKTVRLSFRDAMNTSVQMNASVTYTVPSLIPGRPPLSFTTEFGTETALSLSASVLDRAATVKLVPRAAASQVSPPLSFAAPPGDNKVFTLPDLFAIRGVLRDAAGNVPRAPFVARAFQAQSLISTVSPLAGGEFVLIIPAAASTSDLTVQIVPDSAADPWFAFNPFTPSGMTATSTLDLDPVELADYVVPNKFVVSVVGDDEGGRPVPGALVRASLVLATTGDSAAGPGGTTRFQSEAFVNAQGIAELDLLPGTQKPRAYDIRVIPDAQSPYRGYCRKNVAVTAGPGTLPAVVLKRRQLHAGRLLSADGLPVPGAMVKATPLPGAAGDCTSQSPATAYVVTNLNGTFTIRLDPGMYQFDYEPAPGSPAPRLTDFILQVDESDDPNVDPMPDDDNVSLPAGVLVDGYVTDNVGNPGNPVAGALVRIFQPRCTTADGCAFPPKLLGEAQTDKVGYFRVVMATP